MENSKIYLVTKTYTSASVIFTPYKSVLGAFLNERDARFFMWKHKRSHDTNYSFNSYEIETIEIQGDLSQDKLWKKFSKERIEQIKKDIAKNSACMDKDYEGNGKLRKELESLRTNPN